MIRFIYFFTFLIMLSVSAFSRSSAYVVDVMDGDSIQVEVSTGRIVHIRLFGIDAPELNQYFGQLSKQYLSKLILNKDVMIELLDEDQYGRRLAFIYDDGGNNVNLDLVRSGYAWVYRQYFSDPKWIVTEQQAKASELGLWQQNFPTPPWVFRRR